MKRFVCSLSLIFGATFCASEATAAWITHGKAGLSRVTLEGEIVPEYLERLQAAPMEMPIWWADFESGD